ncbi:MAG: heme exporter protein CcmB [Acidobacteria bacterium]|nr:heme exporter protein CcmB [Acidobacteriota bacterium]
MIFRTLNRELRLQWRSRAAWLAAAAFGVITLLLFSFGVGPRAALLSDLAASFLSLALLLASSLTLAESFQEEIRDGALETMLLLPVTARTIYYGKAISNTLLLCAISLILLPMALVLYDIPGDGLGKVALILFAGSAGLAAPGTLYAAMTAKTRARALILPLLLFPLIVPVLLAMSKAAMLALTGDAMNQLSSWVTLLLIFDAIYWSLCGLLFPRVVDLAAGGSHAANHA